MATAEITQARSRKGAVAFLARLNDHGTPVGAVELSLIELNGCYWNQAPEKNPCLYVTDLVTSWTYQRMGIGKALTKVIEEEACDRGAAWLLLHVEPETRRQWLSTSRAATV
jgi:ribosomal protein S18 acetylase RimI-like enzyme